MGFRDLIEADLAAGVQRSPASWEICAALRGRTT
jgi:hypothetical protein